MKNKKYFQLVLTLIVAIAMSACGKKEDSAKNKSSDASIAKWAYGTDHGVQGTNIYELTNGNMAQIKIVCLDISPASVNLIVDGKEIQPKNVKFKIDDKSFEDAHLNNDCRACGNNFDNFWTEIRIAKNIQVEYDGGKQIFNIKGDSIIPKLFTPEGSSCNIAWGMDLPPQVHSPQKQNLSNTISTNFLIGLCEIPNQSSLNECSTQAIDLSDAPMGSYSIFNNNVVHYVVRSSLKVEEKNRVKNEFDVKIKYEIDDTGSNIITTTTDSSGTCLTRKLYKKQGETISVTRMEMSGSCDELQKKNWAQLDSQYVMKWRRIQ
jgi:hypothetical protein